VKWRHTGGVLNACTHQHTHAPVCIVHQDKEKPPELVLVWVALLLPSSLRHTTAVQQRRASRAPISEPGCCQAPITQACKTITHPSSTNAFHNKQCERLPDSLRFGTVDAASSRQDTTPHANHQPHLSTNAGQHSSLLFAGVNTLGLRLRPKGTMTHRTQERHGCIMGANEKGEASAEPTGSYGPVKHTCICRQM
jgi:hypothetical protein